MDENEWFKKFMGVPLEEQTNRRRWVGIVMWVVGTAMALFIAAMLVGCDNYTDLRRSCKKKCKEVQSNNVGSTFMFRDIHGTFGKCKCHSRSGNVKSFNISIEDLRK